MMYRYLVLTVMLFKTQTDQSSFCHIRLSDLASCALLLLGHLYAMPLAFYSLGWRAYEMVLFVCAKTGLNRIAKGAHMHPMKSVSDPDPHYVRIRGQDPRDKNFFKK